MIKYLFIGFSIIFFNYIYQLKNQINYKCIKIMNKDFNKFVCINIQRLPIYSRNIPKFIYENQYDIICIQEYFMDFMGMRNYNLMNIGYNFCVPGTKDYLKGDSGLVVLSKHPIKFIDFVKFKDTASIDGLIEKGFMVILINNLYIINTHLQANYKGMNNCKIIKKTIK